MGVGGRCRWINKGLLPLRLNRMEIVPTHSSRYVVVRNDSLFLGQCSNMHAGFFCFFLLVSNNILKARTVLDGTGQAIIGYFFTQMANKRQRKKQEGIFIIHHFVKIPLTSCAESSSTSSRHTQSPYP